MPRQFELEKISCEEVVRAYLARIEEVIPNLNAVVQLWLERALIEARNGGKAIARNELTGPLHGVPITIKDNLDTAASSALGKAQRPILWEVFRQLDDRMTRYDPFFLKIFPTPETRPRQREALIEIYSKGKIAQAFQAFKKNYLTVVDGLIDHLTNHQPDEPTR